MYWSTKTRLAIWPFFIHILVIDYFVTMKYLPMRWQTENTIIPSSETKNKLLENIYCSFKIYYAILKSVRTIFILYL